MFIKILGCIVILAATTSGGYVMAGKYSSRVRHLRLVQNGFSMIENEIFFTSTPLPQTFQKTAGRIGKPVNRVFAIASDILNSHMGYTAGEAWSIAIGRTKDILCLNEEDMEILRNFAKSLGCTDKENQEKNFRLVEVQLNLQLKKAEEDRSKNERMYKNLGFLLGATLVILLI